MGEARSQETVVRRQEEWGISEEVVERIIPYFSAPIFFPKNHHFLIFHLTVDEEAKK